MRRRGQTIKLPPRHIHGEAAERTAAGGLYFFFLKWWRLFFPLFSYGEKIHKGARLIEERSLDREQWSQGDQERGERRRGISGRASTWKRGRRGMPRRASALEGGGEKCLREKVHGEGKGR